MSEQSSQNAGNPEGRYPPLPPIEPTLEQRVMSLEAEARSDARQKNPDDLATVVKKAEWWMIGINAATLITTIIIACIYYHQLTQMRIATDASTNAVEIASDSLNNNT